MSPPKIPMKAENKGFDIDATKAALQITPAGRIRGLVRVGVIELGWLGIVAIGIFVMCVTFYFSALQPSEERLQMLRANVAQLENPGTTPAEIGDKKHIQEEQLAVFYRSFPKRSSVPTSLEKIYTAAASERLSLDQADYKVSRASASKMTRYQLTLPIKGQYSDIHKFLVRVLREVPNASLEKVLFERKKIGDPSVDATVILVLHLGSES